MEPQQSASDVSRNGEFTLQTERALLGGIFRHPPSLHDAALLVRPDDFLGYATREIFRAMIHVSDENMPVDTRTVYDWLYQHGLSDDIGGPLTLAEIYDQEPTGALVGMHAQRVRDASVTRQVKAFCVDTLGECERPIGPAGELLENAEKKLFAIGQLGTSGEAASVTEAVDRALNRIDERYLRGNALSGLSTGLTDLDAILCGLQQSELILLAARPSVGKTALAMHFAQHAAIRNGLPTHFVSLEQSHVELGERLVCAVASVNAHRVRSGHVSKSDVEQLSAARAAIANRPLSIDDCAVQTVGRICANARRLKLKTKFEFMVIDYLQLIQPEDRRVARHEQVGVISRRLKLLARELAVPIVCLCQLNRQVEDGGEPKLSHLRESGELEQNADTVLLLHRMDQHGANDVVKIKVAKQRNGPIGDALVLFRKDLQRFENLAMEHQPGA